MGKLLRFIITAVIVLVLVGLGLRIARAFLGVALLVGLGVIAWTLFGPGRTKGPTQR